MQLTAVIPWFVLASHFLFVYLLLALAFRRTWGARTSSWLGERSIPLALLTTLAAVLGSLYYSEVVGYAPCVLCWWQRVFIFPQLILFLTAWKFKDRSAFAYSWRLSVIAGVIAAYHQFTNLGGTSVLPCTAVGAECSKLYVFAFGYITIPMMSLTIALFLILLAWANRIYENNSHA